MTVKAQNILIMTSEFPPQPGGIGNHAYHLAVHLQRHNFKVQVLTDQRSLEGLEEQAFDKALHVKIHRIPIYKIRGLMYLKRLWLLFRLIKTVDVVIASGKFSLWAVAMCSWCFKKKFLAVVHGTEVNFKFLLLRTSIDYALQRFNTVICVSNYTKSLIDRLPLKEVVVIPNGIEISKWSNKAHEPIALNGFPKLVTVGNVTERKGQLHVIRQLPELLKTFPQLHYHCIGIPTEKERCAEVAKDLKVEGHLTFHGQVEDHHLQQLLVGCDVFVMLSGMTVTGDVEGFGIAILEANALGLPAIGAMGSGIEDAIDRDRSGILIPLNDTLSFVKALNTILGQREAFASHAKDWAKQHDWGIIVERYIEVLS